MFQLLADRKIVLVAFLGCAAVIYLSQRTLEDELFSRQNRMEMTDQVKSMMCVGDGLTLDPPEADGYVIKPNLHATQWPLYFSQSANENDDRIFFHETGGAAQLSLIQSCAVESAAYHNPKRPVRLFIRPPTKCSATKFRQSITDQPFFKILDHYKNIEAVLLNEDHYVAGTRFEKWYKKGVWRQSPHEKAHLSDYLRMVTMSKGGGLYLDTDVITFKTYDGEKCRNFFVYAENKTVYVSNTVMHLERDHWLTEEIMQAMADEYDPDDYVYNGIEVITEVIHRLCNNLFHNPKSEDCRKTIKILSSQRFFAIPFMLAELVFKDHGKDTQKVLNELANSFGFHVWNSLFVQWNSKFSLDEGSNHLVAILFRQNCPITTSLANNF